MLNWHETEEPLSKGVQDSDVLRSPRLSAARQSAGPDQTMQSPSSPGESFPAYRNTKLPCFGLQLMCVLAEYVRIMIG